MNRRDLLDIMTPLGTNPGAPTMAKPDRSKELRRDVHNQLEALRTLDQRLAEIVSDEQDIAERECAPDEFDDYTEGENGERQGIVYPEHASPECDHARTLVQQAIEELEDWQNLHGEHDPSEFIEYLTPAVECPNCKEIALPATGGECTECGIPTYFT